jgi:succinate dehydrogenase flavin-adding protein (antitoxin of CptAB toxin-antitoxin module)
VLNEVSNQMNEEELKALRIVLDYMDEDIGDWNEEELNTDKRVVDAVNILYKIKGV